MSSGKDRKSAGRSAEPARKSAVRAKRLPKTLTEKLDTGSRKVGQLSIFGISDYWRVPTILPRRYEDLTQTKVEYDALPDDAWVCVGGTAVGCELVASDAAQGDDEAELLSPGEEREAAGRESDEEGDESGAGSRDSVDGADGADDDPLPERPAADEGDAQGSPAEDGETGFEVIEIVDAADEEDRTTARLNKWRITLSDMTGKGRLRFDLIEKGSAERELVERAKSGGVVWVSGHARRQDGAVVLSEAGDVEGTALGEVHAFYPSKARKEYLKPARKKGAKGRPARGKWVVRKMSAKTTGRLVEDKNRFAIARCAQALRERLGLKSAPDEWLLMKTIGSPGPTLETTLKMAHRPPDVASGEAACRALERLTAVEILQRIIESKEERPLKTKPLRPRRKAFEAALEQIQRNGGIQLTDEQRMCATEILVDLGSERRTHRMLSGDVGTGKTLVLAAAASTLCEDGHLVVVLEPRSSLALQVHRKLKTYFPTLRHQVVTGESKEKKAISGGILVGTTGVWSRLQAAGCQPTLIVADEQQKFGVNQRQPSDYGDANVLESTATAIPRTQALMEFGGMEVSRLTQCHVRKEIETKVVEGKEALEGLYAGLKEAVEKRGRNLLLVYPVIHGSDDDADGSKPLEEEESTPDAINKVLGFWEEMFPGKVDVMHGLLTEAEREGALRKFESGKTSVMIGTSILEVGIDLPKADMMVIHHPERLGVSAVHQLRGRLARQGGKGWCYLAVGAKINEGQMRVMKLMEVENDGQKLAQADMVRRGFGDMRRHAKQQSGLYGGFLVDRPPSIEDIEWVQDHCGRWIGGEQEGADLFDDTQEWMQAAERLLSEGKTKRPRKPVVSPDEQPTGEQPGLFDD